MEKLVKSVETRFQNIDPRQTGDDLGGVDLDKSKVGQRVAEQLADSGLDAVDCLIGHRAQVQDAVVQSRVKVHFCQLLDTRKAGFYPLLKKMGGFEKPDAVNFIVFFANS